jgi:hypothetical protein
MLSDPPLGERARQLVTSAGKLGLVLPREGVDPSAVITGLRDLITQLQNVASTWGAGPDAWKYGQNAYLQAAETIEASLRSWFEDDDGAGAGIVGDGYTRVREMTETTPRPYPLVSAEIGRQMRALRTLGEKLEALLVLRDRPGEPVVLDTNVLMHFLRPDEVPWNQVLGVDQVRIILPIAVIDELDNKKYAGSDRMSGRAALVLRVLRQHSNELGPLVRSRSKQWGEWGGRVFRELRDLGVGDSREVGGSGGCVSDRGMRAPEGIVAG